MNSEQAFKKLEIELKKKKIPKNEINKADGEIKDYISYLEKKLSFRLSLSLKKFVTARR